MENEKICGMGYIGGKNGLYQMGAALESSEGGEPILDLSKTYIVDAEGRILAQADGALLTL